MTCRERLKNEYPEFINDKRPGGCIGCPDRYGYLKKPAYCKKVYILGPAVCIKCWDRDIEEDGEER